MDERSFEQRIQRLETRCSRLNGVVIALAVLLAASTVAAFVAPGAEVVRAQGFELVDATGKVCGRLEIASGTPQLVLTSPLTGAVAGLAAGPSVRAPNGSVHLEMPGKGKPPPALAALSLSGTGENGKPVWTELQVVPSGNALLMSAGDGPTVLLGASVPQDGHAEALLHMCAEDEGDDGHFGRATFGTNVKGGYAKLGADEVDRILLMTDDRTFLELFDPRGKLLFQVP